MNPINISEITLLVGPPASGKTYLIQNTLLPACQDKSFVIIDTNTEYGMVADGRKITFSRTELPSIDDFVLSMTRKKDFIVVESVDRLPSRLKNDTLQAIKSQISHRENHPACGYVLVFQDLQTALPFVHASDRIIHLGNPKWGDQGLLISNVLFLKKTIEYVPGYDETREK